MGKPEEMQFTEMESEWIGSILLGCINHGSDADCGMKTDGVLRWSRYPWGDALDDVIKIILARRDLVAGDDRIQVEPRIDAEGGDWRVSVKISILMKEEGNE